MQTSRRLGLFLGVIGVCFTLGLLSAILGIPGGSSPGDVPTPPLPTWTADPAGSSQTTILVLGVDSLSVSEPRLRAVWWVTFRLPGRELFLLGVPPDYRVGSGLPSLADQFHWSPQAGPGSEFMTVLHTAAPQDVQVTAALDEVGFAALIDYVGGVNLNGVPLRGDQAMAVLGLIEDDASALLTTQSRLLEALIAPAAAMGPSPDVSALIALIPLHAYLSEPFSQLAARLSPLLPLDPAMVHVDLLAAPQP
jgi:hypothetical protein